MDSKQLYDVVVIGGGPAGLTAGLYLARAKYRVLIVEKAAFGGQITITDQVVNYPGVLHTSGKALTETIRQQAQSFGAEFLLAEVTGLSLDGTVKTVQTDRGDLSCFGVLWATGAHPRMVGFPGEEAFRGRGVAYCATCDGEFFTGRDVFVVGGGFAAAEEAVFLTKYARHVTILIRGKDFSCAPTAADMARSHPKITVLTHTQVQAVEGDSALRLLRYQNTETGQVTEYQPPEGETFGLFVFAGYQPATELLQGLAKLDPQGYVLTDKSQQTTGLRPAAPASTPASDIPAAQPSAPAGQSASGSLFPPEMLAQLHTVFGRMASPLVLELTLNNAPVSQELAGYMEALCALTDKLTLTKTGTDPDAPCVRICRADGSWTGLSFHGVPGGHEFTSFVLGLYNAAGPGQALDAQTEAALQAIDRPKELQVLVSLSCTMCPELVTAAQRMAAANPHITAQAYDLNHFPALRDKYHVMSVPCLVVDQGKQVTFGKKNIQQLLDLLS